MTFDPLRLAGRAARNVFGAAIGLALAAAIVLQPAQAFAGGTTAVPAPAPDPAAPAPGESIAGTLTTKDGRTVEALLLSRTDTAVKIRRKADAVEFTIPLDRLSEADRSFILQSSLPTAPGQ